MCKTITALPDGMFRQKVAFNVTDGVHSTDLTTVTFTLNRPIQRVVAISWTYNTVYNQTVNQMAGDVPPVYVLAVDEFENVNTTTGGAGYWKMLGNNDNYTSKIAPVSVQQEKSYTTLTFRLSVAVGTVRPLVPWMIELEFICNN